MQVGYLCVWKNIAIVFQFLLSHSVKSMAFLCHSNMKLLCSSPIHFFAWSTQCLVLRASNAQVKSSFLFGAVNALRMHGYMARALSAEYFYKAMPQALPCHCQGLPFQEHSMLESSPLSMCKILDKLYVWLYANGSWTLLDMICRQWKAQALGTSIMLSQLLKDTCTWAKDSSEAWFILFYWASNTTMVLWTQTCPSLCSKDTT